MLFPHAVHIFHPSKNHSGRGGHEIRGGHCSQYADVLVCPEKTLTGCAGATATFQTVFPGKQCKQSNKNV